MNEDDELPPTEVRDDGATVVWYRTPFHLNEDQLTAVTNGPWGWYDTTVDLAGMKYEITEWGTCIQLVVFEGED